MKAMNVGILGLAKAGHFPAKGHDVRITTSTYRG
jgi:hypothetical protein